MVNIEDLPENLKKYAVKPVKPIKQNMRHGAGKITRDKNGLYIATNPLILENFNLNETVQITGMDSIEYLYDDFKYHLKLLIYNELKNNEKFELLYDEISRLKKENQAMKKELQNQKSLFDFKEGVGE